MIFLQNTRIPSIYLGSLILFLFVFRLFLGWPVIGSDGLAYYAHLRSPLIDGDFHYENEFGEFNLPNHGVPDYLHKTATGHVPNKYGIGPAILWLPFFLLAHLATYCLTLIGLELPLSGYSSLYQFFIGFGTLCYGLVGLFFIHRLCRMFFDTWITNTSIIAVVLATNAVYYLVVEPAMSHALSMATVSCFIYLSIRDYGRKTSISYLWLGLISGLMIMVRYQNALFVILPVFELLHGAFKVRFSKGAMRLALLPGGLYLLITLITLVPQFVVWKLIYGQFLVYTYSGEGFHFFTPKLVQTLFSSRHGLISWTPIIAFSLTGLYFFTKEQRMPGYLFVGCFLIQWYVNSSWSCWWFGDAFGGRAFNNCTFVFAAGLAALLKRFQRKKYVLLTAFSILIFWNALFILQWGMGLIPHQEPISWIHMIRNQVRVVSLILSGSDRFFYDEALRDHSGV